MKKKIPIVLTTLGVLTAILTGCSGEQSTTTVTVTESATTATPEIVAEESSTELDGAFLAQFRMIDGMDDLTQAEAIKLAHSTCTAMEAGNKIEILSVLNDKYGINATAEFMHLAASVYCQNQLTP